MGGALLRHGGRGGGSLMRKYIYSRFKPMPWRFSDSPDPAVAMSSLTTGCFWEATPNWPSLLIGSRGGGLCRFNLEDPLPAWEVQVHDEPVASVAVSRLPAGREGVVRILTSSEKEARVWELSDNREGGVLSDHPLLTLPECANATFSNAYDRIVGTASGGRTLLFDAETSQAIATLQEPQAGVSVPARAVRQRRACFSPEDEMLLSDGVLWDPRCATQCIHKFDRFAHYGGGSFHPGRPEVIISSAIWDIRMSFKLLRWCPSIDQMHTVFNPGGDVMYGFLRYFEEDTQRGLGSRRHVRKYKHMFRTVDAVTYTDIATIELKENVTDLFVDNSNGLIAVMETSRDSFGAFGAACRLYEVGRVKASPSDDEDEEEATEEEREEDEEDEDGGGDHGHGGGPDEVMIGDHFLTGDPAGLAMLSGLLSEGEGDSDSMGSQGMSDSSGEDSGDDDHEEVEIDMDDSDAEIVDGDDIDED